MVGKRRLRRLLLLLDFLWIGSAIFLAYAWRTGNLQAALGSDARGTLLWLMFICLPLWTMTARKLSLDQLQDLSKLSAIVSRVVTGVLVLVPLTMGLAFLARNMYSRLFFVYLGLLLSFGFIGIRFVVRKLVLHFRSYFVLRTVIIGTGRIASEIAGKITAAPELMRDLVAFVHPSNRERPNFAPVETLQARTALSSVSLLDLLRQNSVGEVIIAGPELNAPNMNQLISQCRQHEIEVSVLPQLYELYSSQARILDLGGLPLVKVESRTPQPADFWVKRLLDLVLLIPLITFALPLALFIAAYLIARGCQVLHAEPRCGKGGVKFSMYRFGLPRHADDLSGFESILDRLSLTELPQLWNVFMGDMSIVGPRPEDPCRVQDYSAWQRQRLAMPPGITGLAQVHGLRDSHSSDEKSRYDLQYIRGWSPLLDLSLIMETAWTVCFRMRDSRSISKLRRQESVSLHVASSEPVSLGEADVNRAQSGAD
jgi:lipopolysaccharide/colanic/teichoic acid biosynthesis glycosyltransferase